MAILAVFAQQYTAMWCFVS